MNVLDVFFEVVFFIDKKKCVGCKGEVIYYVFVVVFYLFVFVWLLLLFSVVGCVY